MINTWYPEINSDVLQKLKMRYEDSLKENQHSSFIKVFNDKFRSEYIYNTNAIEGNKISEYDTAFIINSQTFLSEYSAKDNMEVLGSNNAWNYVLSKPEVSTYTLKQIHKRILFFDVENAGVFRNIPIYVGDKKMLNEDLIEEAISKLLKPLKNIDIFKEVADFHLKFENIHPFVDGNGRTGRMLINLQLISNGFLPVNIKFNDAGKYYRCFRQYDISEKRGIQEMFNLLTKYEYEQLMAFNELVKK